MRERATRCGHDDGSSEAHGRRPLDGVLEFLRLIWGVSHGLQSTSKRMEASLGITGPQRLVVRVVGRYPGVLAGEIAEILHLHPSTLTGVLRRLEDRGIICRAQGKRDRRKAIFRLTAAGRAVDRRHAGTVEAAVRRVLARLEPRTLEMAAHVLRELEAELGVTPDDTSQRASRSAMLPRGTVAPRRRRVGTTR
jgi:MarR family transcriptional regulator, organic hydroperoxide resistance regulator